MAELALIYRRLVGARVRSQYQYRLSFWLFIVSQFLITFTDFLAIVVIFAHVPRLADWSLGEVAFLYGLSGVAFGLADIFVSQVEDIPRRVKDGSFDQLLVRPLGTLLQISSDDFQLRRVGKLAQAVTILSIAATRVHIGWTAAKVLVTLSSVVSGACIFGAVWVIGAGAFFWIIDGREVINSFTYGGNFLTQYPLQVYGSVIRRLLAFAIPLAFVAFFPALYVLGKPDPFTSLGFVRFLSPAVALVMIGCARVAWGGAIRHYRSTGS